MQNKYILIGAVIVTVIISFFMFSSTNSVSQEATNNQPPTISVPFTKLVQGTHSSVTRRVNYFITSPEELKLVWKMVNATTTPPTVDFKKDAVIAVFAGAEPVSAISVAKIEDADSRLVSITLAKPNGVCAKKQSNVLAYQLISVPTTSLPLAHKDIVVPTTCTN